MANVNIPDLTALTAPAAADVIEVYDDSAAANRKLALSYVALTGTSNVFTESQVIQKGASELQVRNDATRALSLGSWDGTSQFIKSINLGVALTPLVLQASSIKIDTGHLLIGTTTDSGQLTVRAGSTSTVGLVVDTPASPTVAQQEWRYNGVVVADLSRLFASQTFQLYGGDFGANVPGARIFMGRNSNASPGAPHMIWIDKGGSAWYLHVDDSGILRVGSTEPTGPNDTANGAVGDQTSTLASKIMLGGDLTPGEALRTILQTPVKHFKYKSNAYNGSEFYGIIADYSPAFAMDEGRVFNPVSAFGYAVQAIKALTERITQLEAN